MKLFLAMALVVAAPSGLAPVQFPATPGWHTGAAKPGACPGVSTSRCTQAWSWSSTVRWRDCVNCVPHRTLAVLPRDGVIIAVSRVRERPVIAKRLIQWPPHIKASDVTGGMEGVPRRYGVYQLFARLLSKDTVLVWAYFGRSHPSNVQLAAANAQLRSARLP